MHVLGEIHHHRDVAALSGKAGAAATRQNGRAMFSCKPHCRFDILSMSGNYDPDRFLAIVGPVGGVEGARPLVETDFAVDYFC